MSSRNCTWTVYDVRRPHFLFAAAVIASVLGQGGGALYTPIQVWLGVGFHEAATTSLFLIMVMSLSSSLVYRKANRIDWSLVVAFESVSVTGAFAGGAVSDFLSTNVLSVLFSAVLALAAYLMIKSTHDDRRKRHCPARWFLLRRQLGGQEYQVNMILGTTASFVAGLLSGLLGVGGGILKMPMMVLLLGIPVEIAIGSSALMVGLTAAGGFGGHLIQGHWNWHASLLLGAVVFLGAQLGSRISVGLDSGRLKTISGWFLLAVAILMAVQTVS